MYSWPIKQFFCDFFFPIVFKNNLIIPLVIRNTRPIIALAIPVGVPMTEVNKKRETPMSGPNKTSQVLSA